MTQQPQTSNPDRPKPYGRAPRRRQAGRYVMTVLRMDADEAVRRVMATYNISASGAVHHLVRLGAGLPPLI
jgi:hypothetical protein